MTVLEQLNLLTTQDVDQIDNENGGVPNGLVWAAERAATVPRSDLTDEELMTLLSHNDAEQLIAEAISRVRANLVAEWSIDNNVIAAIIRDREVNLEVKVMIRKS